MNQPFSAVFDFGAYDRYSEACESTAIYPRGNVLAPMPYVVLGLVSEIAELQELFALPGRAIGSVQLKQSAIKELGDVQWYVARLCFERGWRFAHVVQRAREEWKVPFDRYGDAIDRMAVSGGNIAGIVKKLIRDGEPEGAKKIEVDEKLYTYLVAILKASFDLTYFLSTFGGGEYVSYDRILIENTAKLQGRKERGVLGGSGDNR